MGRLSPADFHTACGFRPPDVMLFESSRQVCALDYPFTIFRKVRSLGAARLVSTLWQMLDALVQPFRTIVLIGLCFGLRISEILGLRWTDFDFKRSVVLVQRSAVGKRLNKLKTEYSQDEVPIERGFILELKKWQALCLDTEEHWLFPSPVTGRPYHADSMRNDYLVPRGLKLGLGRIGFHTFRHTYRAWLDETGAPVDVQQKLMRHAHVSTTMDQYGNASALAKRKANRPIVQR
ncbi:MAG: tyrosine-type recombinase/integrase, partial [Candidatus Sulfotelmatobacter sp.]